MMLSFELPSELNHKMSLSLSVPQYAKQYIDLSPPQKWLHKPEYEHLCNCMITYDLYLYAAAKLDSTIGWIKWYVAPKSNTDKCDTEYHVLLERIKQIQISTDIIEST
ncbi:hypothetical protein FGSG_11650 [Fusarium graminearum PH-1]|uniref:Chromosome 1, complete genome n=1 Tax=Gibberella zeae (strain ATCC MYA-4620 / CBS 123657 / FGSC 9075 / NRRL 31084 / PH-1) TaxID=229533 RepID=I1S483_GIBZE|nr:hypothetical protein FGSG_11650 [Fusarium graminearum PH-1]ESU05114.1 hypothetical protein FGSG_11650 [Fusarium graminearum PH-1]CEF71839.1 unnamed protein product [Fusarium graminearum]|eukprot:XP_011315599.1 hypothetical protein FGSG_11650 [Fusarium graminearum PH-1]